MRTPYIAEYAASLALGRRTLKSMPAVTLDTAPDGRPVFACGGNSVVFFGSVGQWPVAVKCYLFRSPRRAELYSALESFDLSSYVSKMHYFENEMTVFTDMGAVDCDILLCRRENGLPLDARIAELQLARDFERLAQLADSFDRFAYSLSGEEWAHGDMKPENIIVTSEGLRLIDFDAAYVPRFAGYDAAENGTPEFNHPSRNKHFYNKHIDDFGLALTAVNLRLAALRSAENLTSDTVCNHTPHNMARITTAVELLADKGFALEYTLLQRLGDNAENSDLHSFFAPDDVTGIYEPFEQGGRWGYRGTSGIAVAPVWDEVLDRSDKPVCRLRDIWCRK